MKRHLAALLAVAAIAAAAGNSPSGSPDRPSWPRLAAFAPEARSAPLSAAGRKRISAASWLGGPYTTAGGETVVVFVSDSYAPDPATGQRWAEFFAGLIHGAELRSVQAYVAPLDEVQVFCGVRTLGCYGGGRLVTIGEAYRGVTAEEVAAHEYGHHVASTRRNPPWQADAWGPKRWASHVGICARADAGTVFPGDEGANYELNPGEGFAEVYRVLNEVRHGATSFNWTLVDPSFSPDKAALAAAEADVLQPWTAPETRTLAGRFTARGARVWRVRILTALDGDLEATLRAGAGAGHELVVLDGSRVVARGLWSGSGEKRVHTRVCGQRSLVLRVSRKGPAGRFGLRLSAP